MTGSLDVLITEYPAGEPGSGPYGITAGPDNAVWFTQVHHGQIGRMSLSGEYASYQLDPPSGNPSVIVTGPDGALWFTESRAHRIGRITTAGRSPSSRFPPRAASRR